MSTHNITDLLRELQAGEEARAKIPELQAQSTRYVNTIDKLSQHNQALELSILGYKSTISDLTTKVARLEVERDDAGFRELEAAERVNTLTDTLKTLAGNIGDTLRVIDPPTPEPVPQPIVPDAGVLHTAPVNVPITNHGAERAADPTAQAVPVGTGTNASMSGATTTENVSQLTTTEQSPSSGQRVPLPTVDVPATDTSQLQVVGQTSVDTTTNAPMLDQAQAYRPFGGDAVGSKPTTDYPDGKRWYDKPSDMTIAEWVATGGQP